MKFAVFGLLVVCAFALPFNVRFANMKFEVPRIDDPVHLYPKGIPCAVSISYDAVMYSTAINESGTFVTVTNSSTINDFYGFMVRSESTVTDEDGANTTTTLTRLDLTETKDGIVYATQFINDGSSCAKEMIAMDKAETEGIYERDLFSYVKTFMGVNDTVFDGVNCKVYYNETDSSAFYLYVDAERNIIGQYIFFMVDDSHFVNGTVRFTYNDYPTLDDFVMDKTENPGCDEAAYKAPGDFQCIGAVYTPPELPCPFAVERFDSIGEQPHNKMVVEGIASEGLLSTYFLMSEEKNISIVRRADLRDKNGIPVFIFSEDNETCNKVYHTSAEVAKALERELAFFRKTRRFENVSTQASYLFGDTIYAYQDNEYTEALVVDSATKRIGFYGFKNATFTLMSHILPLPFNLTFVTLNETAQPNCDPAVYIQPTGDYPCEEPSGSSDSSDSSAASSSVTSSTPVSSAVTSCASVLVLFSLMVIICLF